MALESCAPSATAFSRTTIKYAGTRYLSPISTILTLATRLVVRRSPVSMTSSEASRFTDAPNMQQYPDPNAGADGAGQPFYSPGQQQSAAPNSDELQLTAQLTREVAPMMNAGLGGSMSERQGSHGPSQGNLQGNMNHDYDHGPHPQQMSPFHHPINQLGAQYGEPDGQPPAKKRNTGKAGGDKKSSRACDECRRKKVKCDAPQPAEGESVQCSGCKRTNVMCQFERQQQKRGPSKGCDFQNLHA